MSVIKQKFEFDGRVHNIDVDVDSRGYFSAEFGDESFSAESLSGVMEKVKQAIRESKTELKIPCSLIDLEPSKPSKWGNRTDPYESGTGVVHAIYRGRHARTRAFLFTDLKGKKFQDGGYSGIDNLCPRLTDAQVREYDTLAANVAAADKAISAWRKKHVVTPTKLENKGGED